MLPALMLSVLHTKVICLEFSSNTTIQYILFTVKRDELKLVGRVAAVQLRPMAQLTSVSILHGPASVCSTVVQDLRAAPLSALQTQQFTPAQGFSLKLADLMVSWTPCVCSKCGEDAGRLVGVVCAALLRGGGATHLCCVTSCSTVALQLLTPHSEARLPSWQHGLHFIEFAFNQLLIHHTAALYGTFDWKKAEVLA